MVLIRTRTISMFSVRKLNSSDSRRQGSYRRTTLIALMRRHKIAITILFIASRRVCALRVINSSRNAIRRVVTRLRGEDTRSSSSIQQSLTVSRNLSITKSHKTTSCSSNYTPRSTTRQVHKLLYGKMESISRRL